MTILKDDIIVTGLSIVTTNHNNQGMKDIGQLWQNFLVHPVFSTFAKEGRKIYVVYDQYESDHTGFYRVTIGYKNLEALAQDAKYNTVKIKAGIYKEFEVSPATPEKIGEAWQGIWEDKSLKRSFDTDFEVYKNDQMIINLNIAS